VTTYTWKTGVSNDWATPADWSSTSFPDASDAAALIDATGVGYRVTIAVGESDIVNQLTIGNNFVNVGLTAAPTLYIAGTLQFAGSNATSAFLQGGLVIAATGVVEGAGELGESYLQGVAFNFTNAGTIVANAGSNSSLFILSAFTNSGTLLADSGALYVEGTSFANISGTTLTGGSYIVQGPSVGTDNQIGFDINNATDIATDAANIVLDGGATELFGYNGDFVPLESQLETIASAGSLQLLDGRGYITSNALTDDGLLLLQGGSLATDGLGIGNAGTFEGYGVVSGSVSNNGGIVAEGGALYLPGTVASTGALTVEPGSSLILAGADPSGVTNNGIIYDTSGLLDVNALTGSGTLVVQPGGTLWLDAATSEEIVFSGTNAAVTLATPLVYSGTVAGLGLGDSLVLNGISANAATVVNANTLAVTSGGVTVDTVTLAGNYGGASFIATTSGTATFISNTGGAPARDDMAFTISVDNTASITGAQETAILNDLSAAALDWAQYVTGHAPLRIQLNITTGAHGNELANGGFASSIDSGEVINGETVVIPSSIYALTTGNYVPGSTADVIINLPLSAGELDSAGGLFAAPDPATSGDPLPGNEYDLLSVFRHELAHGLGFGGLTQQNGSLGPDETLWDSYIQDTATNGTITAANFVGPDAEAAYGAWLGTDTPTPVPLTLLNNGENFAHVANSSTDPLAQDLMSGLGIGAGQMRDISSVDLAMLQDVGLPVTAAAMCFLRGTLIRVPSGEIPVEQLRPGELVLTHDGKAQPIVWIGEGRVLATRGRRSAATPVIVRKGALADNVPHHDLRLTNAHALWFDGALVPAEFLVNHRSILWDDRAQEVHLFHIELETHAVLLANGAAAESYRDDGNRWLFRNANTGWHLPPKPPCAPVLTGGAFVDALWRRLLHRAGPRPGQALTDDPDLHLLLDGQRVDASAWQQTVRIFAIASPCREIRIVSRAAVPAELGLARDPRTLGVALRQIVVRQGTRFAIIDAANPLLRHGFHAFEQEAGLRWTDGDGVIPVDAFAGFSGALELIVHLGAATRYPAPGPPAAKAVA